MLNFRLMTFVLPGGRFGDDREGHASLGGATA